MDRVQRVLGWVLSVFCAYLLIVNPIARWSVGEPVWLSSDWITASVGILTAVTALRQFVGARAIQILCFLAVAIGALANKSQTIGLMVLDMGFFLALFYGWYTTLPLPKVIGTGLFFFAVIYAFDKATTNNNFMVTFHWILAFIGQALFFWGLYRSKMKDAILVAKTYKDELDKKERHNAP